MDSPTRADGLPQSLLDTLDDIPFKPRDVWRDPGYYLGLAKTALDFFAHNMPRWNALLVKVNPYPRPWTPVRIPVGRARDVVQARVEGTDPLADACGDEHVLCGWYGAGRPGAPALLYVPGTFQTKDDTERKRRAIHMHRALGWHVLVVDLRGFGESHTSLGTGGFVEAHDLHRAADWLRNASGADRVTVMGESLGGASALIAAGLPGAESRFNGVLAWSPFADLVSQTEYACTNPGPKHPFFVPYSMYRIMVYARSRGQARDFREFIAQRARELGVDADTFLRLASPERYVCDVAVPALVYHAEDDPIVPVAQARILERACADNPRVAVRVQPAGGHADFDVACPAWYWDTVRAFVDHVNPGAAHAAQSRSVTLREEAGWA